LRIGAEFDELPRNVGRAAGSVDHAMQPVDQRSRRAGRQEMPLEIAHSQPGRLGSEIVGSSGAAVGRTSNVRSIGTSTTRV